MSDTFGGMCRNPLLDVFSMISKEILQCVEDMHLAVQEGKMSLDAQVRAYDLVEKLLDLPDGGTVGPADVFSDTVATWCSCLGPAEEFCAEYARCASDLESVYDEDALLSESASRLESYRKELEQAHKHSLDAADLHQCAKSTFEIWQRGGLFARQRALRTLRSKAGFRLETERIGNYVAKTFDLMNEANAEYARAQQRLFKADASYKVKPGLYARLADVLSTVRFDSRTEG